jgi:hypothetical protein
MAFSQKSGFSFGGMSENIERSSKLSLLLNGKYPILFTKYIERNEQDIHK